jgi:hypothetical protein
MEVEGGEAAARDSSWTVVPNAGKDAQGDEWFAFGSVCGVVGMVEKGDTKYAGLLFRSGGEGRRIFCCMREGDVGETEHFSVPLWGLGTPQGAMGGQPLAPGVALGSACWRVEDGGNGVAVLRHSESAGLGVFFLPKEGKVVYMCPDGVDLALIISPRSHPVCASTAREAVLGRDGRGWGAGIGRRHSGGRANGAHVYYVGHCDCVSVCASVCLCARAMPRCES